MAPAPPGWQIALIAAGTALLAPTVAVLVDRALLPRRAAPRAQTVLPAAADAGKTGSARPEIRSDRLRRASGPLRRAPTADGSCHDPLFERPDLVEDDYYRFRHQPHGW